MELSLSREDIAILIEAVSTGLSEYERALMETRDASEARILSQRQAQALQLLERLRLLKLQFRGFDSGQLGSIG
jgi:hypothetical protein